MSETIYKNPVKNESIYDMIDSRIITEFAIFHTWLQKQTGLFSLNKDDNTCVVLDPKSSGRTYNNELKVCIGLNTKEEIFIVLKALYPDKTDKEIVDTFLHIEMKKEEMSFETTDEGHFVGDPLQLAIPDYAYISDCIVKIPELNIMFGENEELSLDIKIFHNFENELDPYDTSFVFPQNANSCVFSKAIAFWGMHNFYRFAKPVYDNFKDIVDSLEIDCDEVDLTEDFFEEDIDDDFEEESDESDIEEEEEGKQQELDL